MTDRYLVVALDQGETRLRVLAIASTPEKARVAARGRGFVLHALSYPRTEDDAEEEGKEED